MMPLFLFVFDIFIVHTFILSHSYSTFILRHLPRFLSISSLLWSAQWEKPPCSSKTYKKALFFNYKLNISIQIFSLKSNLIHLIAKMVVH